MTTAVDVLDYIQSRWSLLGEVQAHKLVYYAQGWSLAWDGAPLFDDPIQAWTGGPVAPVVRDAWRTRQTRILGPRSPAVSKLTKDEEAKVDAVLAYYGGTSGGQLSQQTHLEQPWLDARGDLPKTAPSTREITHQSMRREYSLQSLDAQGPKRPISHTQEASLDDVLAVAAEDSRRWSQTLALLAE